MDDVNQDMLEVGTTVRLKSDPGRQGVITGKTRQQAGILKYQVGFPEGRSWCPDYELEVVEDDESDWEELLKSGRFGRVRDLRRNITHIHLSGRLGTVKLSRDRADSPYEQQKINLPWV